MLRLRRPCAAVLALLTLWPTLGFAQSPKAGVVTTLEGNVTVTRVAVPQVLKVKDEVFVNDKVTTGDRSLARMLLDGKAVVTVRERSVLTITEIPGKSTIYLDSGKIALVVAKEKMRPGESIEIRTQNAIAGVRGTVVIAEVSRATAQLGGAAAGIVTTFSILRGIVEALQVNPATGAPLGPPVSVGVLQQFKASGQAPASLTAVPPGEVPQILSGLSTSGMPAMDGGGNQQAKEIAIATTVALVQALTGTGATAIDTTIKPRQLANPTETENTPPILPGNEQCASCLTTPPPPPPSGPPSNLPTAFLEVSGSQTLDTLVTFPAGRTTWGGVAGQEGPYARILNASVDQSTGNPLVGLPAGSVVQLAGVGLLEVINSAVMPSSDLLSVSGNLTQLAGATTPAVLDLNNTFVSWGGEGVGRLLSMNGGTIDAAGALLRLTNGAFVCGSCGATAGALTQIYGGSVTLGGSFLRMFSAAGQLDTFLSTANSALAAFGGASITTGGAVADIRDGAHVQVIGSQPLLSFIDASATATGNVAVAGLAGGSGVTPMMSLGGGLLHATATSTPLTFASGTQAAPRSFVAILDGATVVNSGGDFLSFIGAPDAGISVHATSNVFALATTTASAVAPVAVVFDRLVYAASTTLTSGTPTNNGSTVFVGDGATLVYAPTPPLVQGELVGPLAAVPSLLEFSTSNVIAPGTVVAVRRSPSASMPSSLILNDGGLISATNTAFNNLSSLGVGGGPCCPGIYVGQGGLLASSSATSSLVTLQNSTWTSTGWVNVEDACLGCLDAFHATTLPGIMFLAGGLLDSTDSTLNSMFSGLFLRRSIFGGGSATNPVFDFHSTVDTTLTFGMPIPAGFTGAGTVGFGSLLNATACVPGVGTCTGTFLPDTTPVRGDTSILLGGSLLRAFADPGHRTTFTTSGDFVIVSGGASLISNATDTLIVSTRSTFNVGTALVPVPHRHFILANGMGGLSGTTPSLIWVSGRLLDSQDDIFNVGAGFLETSGGSAAAAGPVLVSRTNADASPLLAFTGSTVTLGASGGSSGNVVDIRPFTGITSNGPLLQAAGTGSTVPWTVDRLLLVDCSGAACNPGMHSAGLETLSTAPLFTFLGGFSGAHTVNSEMFRLTGSITTLESDPDAAGHVVAMSQPVRHVGVLFSGVDTSVNADKVMRVDTALLQASAPLLSLAANSTLTSASHALELVNAAKLNASLSGDALFKLNASTLNILNGSLVSLSGSSFMTVVGNLLALLNGSTANITNGGLVSVSGTSVFRLTNGSLAVFGPSGTNTLNITGTSATGTLNTSIPGLPVVLKNGASISQVSVAPGFTAFAGGTPNFGATGAALVVDGTAAKIKLGP